jgi:hypothetical protein
MTDGETCLRAPRTSAGSATLPDYAEIPPSALGPALNEQGYCVGRVERNLIWVTDDTYQSAFVLTDEGVLGAGTHVHP